MNHNQPPNDCTQGLEECKFIVQQVIQVVDSETNTIVDITTYDMRVKTTYAAAMAIKYLALKRSVEGGVETFLKILGLGGDAVQVLRED